MTEENKRKLSKLLEEAMIGLRASDAFTSLDLDAYRRSGQQNPISYWRDFTPRIQSESTKSKLLDIIRSEFSQFIRDDKIMPASEFIQGGPVNGCPIETLLQQLLRIAILKGIQNAVLEFDSCTKAKFATFQEIAILEGIKLKAQFQVSPDVRLIPLPSSTSKLPAFLTNLAPDIMPASFFYREDITCH